MQFEWDFCLLADFGQISFSLFYADAPSCQKAEAKPLLFDKFFNLRNKMKCPFAPEKD